MLAILTSAAFGLLMFRMLACLPGGYYGAVVTTAHRGHHRLGPIALAFLRRSTDEQGEQLHRIGVPAAEARKRVPAACREELLAVHVGFCLTSLYAWPELGQQLG